VISKVPFINVMLTLLEDVLQYERRYPDTVAFPNYDGMLKNEVSTVSPA